jgi:hypothetical protein
MTQQFKNGFEFLVNGEEAMIWSAKENGSGEWVYIVVIAWSRLTVMREAEIEQTAWK